MSARKMFRFEIPVDDAPHPFTIGGVPVAAATDAGDPSMVEFWAEHGLPLEEVQLQIFGTGQPIPETARWCATCPRHPGSGLVWHLYEVEATA